ncbi:hypothetical protein Tco_1353935 [Tanacetum coccineum]
MEDRHRHIRYLEKQELLSVSLIDNVLETVCEKRYHRGDDKSGVKEKEYLRYLYLYSSSRISKLCSCATFSVSSYHQKVLNHDLSIWTLIEIFLKHLDSLSRHIINLTAEGDLRKFSDIGAWVQVPRCMAWLDYDEHVDSLSTMDNEVGVTSPESTTQTLPSFEEYTPPMTYPEEVEKTLGTPLEVEPLNETKLEEVDLNYNHNTPLSSREVPSFDGP